MTPTVQPALTPDRIMQFAWGYSAPLLIEAGVQLKVFDALASGPRSLEEVSRETGASVRGLQALMDALAGFQLLNKNAGVYSNGPEADAFLVSTRPGFQGGLFRHVSSQLIPKWLNLTEIVRTGKPVAPGVNQEDSGAEFFQQFVEDIFPMSYRAACTLAEALVARAEEPVSVLDLAAGSGVWGIAMAQASPMVRITAVDWSGVLPVTQKMVGRFGLADRFQFVAGDLLKADFGSGHGIATLGHILHSEGEARSRELLKKVFAALASGGNIAIQEFLVNEDRSGPLPGLIFAVNMLVNTDVGNTYSVKEIGGWLEDSGFRQVRTIDAPGPSPIILATKP